MLRVHASGMEPNARDGFQCNTQVSPTMMQDALQMMVSFLSYRTLLGARASRFSPTCFAARPGD